MAERRDVALLLIYDNGWHDHTGSKPADFGAALLGKEMGDEGGEASDIDTLSEAECIHFFHFTSEEIRMLVNLLQMPPTVRARNGIKASGLEVSCIVLRRLAYPCCYLDICKMFHQDQVVSDQFHGDRLCDDIQRLDSSVVPPVVVVKAPSLQYLHTLEIKLSNHLKGFFMAGGVAVFARTSLTHPRSSNIYTLTGPSGSVSLTYPVRKNYRPCQGRLRMPDAPPVQRLGKQVSVKHCSKRRL